MEVKQAYNQWASQYDTNANRTRDLEARAIRSVLEGVAGSVLEVGCGTGKNSVWLAENADLLLGIDLSPEMLALAKAKVNMPGATFVQADICCDWGFTAEVFDAIVFSLVLEHVEDLSFVFSKAREKLKEGGLMYVGELHPFKQYLGTKARFDAGGSRIEVTCFQHHISEFLNAAQANGFRLLRLEEWFDDKDISNPPRILTLLFQAV